jgi:hypothetical protein
MHLLFIHTEQTPPKAAISSSLCLIEPCCWSCSCCRSHNSEKTLQMVASGEDGGTGTRRQGCLPGSDANLAEHEAVGDSLLLAGTATIACWSKRVARSGCITIATAGHHDNKPQIRHGEGSGLSGDAPFSGQILQRASLHTCGGGRCRQARAGSCVVWCRRRLPCMDRGVEC